MTAASDDDYATWLTHNPAPDLGELIRAHGGYNNVSPEAWAAYDRAVAAWQLRRRERYGGAVERVIDRRPKRASGRASR